MGSLFAMMPRLMITNIASTQISLISMIIIGSNFWFAEEIHSEWGVITVEVTNAAIAYTFCMLPLLCALLLFA